MAHVMCWGDNDLVRTWPDGRMTWHRGATSDSRMSRQRWPDGREAWYEGAWGEERVTLMTYPCGKKECYVDERGKERLHEIHYPDDTIEYYHGARGHERVLYTCTKAEDDAFHSDDETPYEWQTHRTGEENMQRERMRQAVLERRQGPLREALKTCTNAREFLCRGVTYDEVHTILKENATNVLKGKIEALRYRIPFLEFSELEDALEAYSAFVR